MNTKKIISILIFIFIIISALSCGRSSDDVNGALNNPKHISFKIDGNLWSGDAYASVNDKNKPLEDAYLLMTAYKPGVDDNNAPPFVMMLDGVNLKDNQETILYGGFSGGNYFGMRVNGVDYVTNNAPDNQQSGKIKVLKYGSSYVATFSGDLYSATGVKMTVTEGVVDTNELQHF